MYSTNKKIDLFINNSFSYFSVNSFEGYPDFQTIFDELAKILSYEIPGASFSKLPSFLKTKYLFAKGKTNGQCARGTGTMVINAVAIKNGGTGREMKEGDSHGGSAKAAAHHTWIESQGWTKYSFTGLTKAQARDIVENGPLDTSDPTGKKRVPWIAGDVV